MRPDEKNALCGQLVGRLRVLLLISLITKQQYGIPDGAYLPLRW